MFHFRDTNFTQCSVCDEQIQISCQEGYLFDGSMFNQTVITEVRTNN